MRDVIEQREKRRKEEAERLKREKELGKINPFSGVNSALSGTAQNSLGTSLFGGSAATSPATGAGFNPFASSAPAKEEVTAAAATNASSDPVPSFSALSVETPPTTSQNAAVGPSTPTVTYAPPIPAYQPAQYISTFEEYVPRLDHPTHASRKGVSKEYEKFIKQADDEDEGGKGKSGGGGGEGGGPAEQWERVLPKGVDEVFERFVNRLKEAEDGEQQVLR